MSTTKLKFTFSFILYLSFIFVSSAQNRTEIDIPNVLGYQTLKCDFHMHTVFSDGDVWPTVRVEEAWREGLDAISITDHIEYLPHSQDIVANHNRSYEIAKPLAEQLGLLLIRGTEITRQMPPGHLTALFVKNANLLEREDWWEACIEAMEQDAFIFWSHPGRKDQQPIQTLWWEEHTRLMDAGILKGIEIYSNDESSTESLFWANEKNLTIFANSDLHEPASMAFNREEKQRPITLVFASEKTTAAIKNAIIDHRTAAYFNDTIIGDRRFLTPIFLNSIELKTTKIELQNHEVKLLNIHNNSDIPFKLKKRQPSAGFSGPDEIILESHRTVSIELTGTSNEVAQMSTLKMYYEVTNMLTKNGKNLPINIDIPNK